MLNFWVVFFFFTCDFLEIEVRRASKIKGKKKNINHRFLACYEPFLKRSFEPSNN